MRDLPISFRRRRGRRVVVVKNSEKASQSDKLISIFSSCPSCGTTGKMSSMPMGHFAAFKVRQQMNSGHVNGNEGGSGDGKYGTSQSFSATKAMTPSASNDGCPDNPTKYTSKAMMAIWGAYNRSVHHFKSNAFDKA